MKTCAHQASLKDRIGLLSKMSDDELRRKRKTLSGCIDKGRATLDDVKAWVACGIELERRSNKFIMEA